MAAKSGGSSTPNIKPAPDEGDPLNKAAQTPLFARVMNELNVNQDQLVKRQAGNRRNSGGRGK